MLSELAIENFAIIDRLLLRFSSGFTVLTGETGAGKSIIIDALQIALGARAGVDVVRDTARAASVEAIFHLGDSESAALRPVLEEYGVEDGETLILRRDVAGNGRSTPRINGRAVPLAVLAAVGTALVDIHGQSDHLSLLHRSRQLDVLDRYGDLLPLRAEVAAAIKEYVTARDDLERLAGGQRETEQRLDLLRFQVGEIAGADLRTDEEEELHVERNLLVNAEKLANQSTGITQQLQGDSPSVIEGVYTAASTLRELAGVDPSLGPLASRLESLQYELEDIAQEVRRYRDAVESDPARLQEIEERLDLLNRLKRKYGPELSDVIAFGEGAQLEIDEVEHLDERLEDLRLAVEGAQHRAGDLAGRLSGERRRTAEALDEAMAEALEGLALKSTHFQAEVRQVETDTGLPLPGSGARYAYTQSGVDAVNFLVAFNPGEPLRPIERVASGGEVSRFLLALKSVLAGADGTPTLVFDEVDVGVGGRGGMVVGERLRDLSRQHQVLSITHLPQVAALADQHIRVSKSESENQSAVVAQVLETPDRVAELAEMMTGTGTEAARRNARELLEAADRYR